MCTNQSPWAVNDDLAYGFAAVKLAGKTERDWCCACYEYVYLNHSAERQNLDEMWLTTDTTE